ncbi:FtsX-like permease family protein [Catenuloplanes atrovinosus]|uniref:ABC transport system permease protein n=1 Tax=Catenuloplanes atrovinosus TaxID=137266 RepID=A0AAE3YRF6_9ACTN|nr:FtsX-like permease family protein [Catenuloplanes atrovinosus]MDR7277315.1 putative ABC transport system permease protein [Catenuloplanes atrovinosus]
MLSLSWAGFRERWTLFIGATVTVALGVGLVQSSLLLLISAATLAPPDGASPIARMRFATATEASVALIAVTLGFAALLAVFIISSTFAFAVEQRRRDLALLRLAGASRGHVRQLLLGEAVLLGAVGTVAGVPAGLALMAAQSWLLQRLGFVPDGFAGQWRGWILFVSAGTGIGLAVMGVLLAARRAARVRPLEALRDSGDTIRVMTIGRWSFGLLFAAGAAALIGLSPVGGAVGGQAMAMNVSVCAAIAFTLLGPALVPAVSRLLPSRAVGVLGELAGADLRDDVRRSASTAAPLIVLTGLLLGQAVASTSFAEAGRQEHRRDTVADLVVETTGPIGDRIASVPGVRSASTEAEVPVALTTGSGELRYTRLTSAVVIDPAGYRLAHPGSGDGLGALAGSAVARGPGADGFAAGDTVGVRVGDTDLGSLPVVAEVPSAIGGGATLLIPEDVLPAELLADAPVRTFVSVTEGTAPEQVAASLTGSGAEVLTQEEWLARDSAVSSATSTGVLVVVMGLGSLYALIGVVNSVVIGAATRRREFAAARAVGFTRGQVVRTALLESVHVTTAGLVLGGIAAAGTLVAALATTSAVTGDAIAAVPWPLVAAVVAGAFLITGVTTVATSLSATHGRLVELLGARE